MLFKTEISSKLQAPSCWLIASQPPNTTHNSYTEIMAPRRRGSPETPPREPSSDRLFTPQSSPEYWTRLSAELRLIILDQVVEDYYFQPSKPHLRTGYATVCREWQPVFEKQNFRRLVLDYHRLPKLEKFTAKNDRRSYVEQIFLRVRLEEYDCSVCKRKENDRTKTGQVTCFRCCYLVTTRSINAFYVSFLGQSQISDLNSIGTMSVLTYPSGNCCQFYLNGQYSGQVRAVTVAV